MREKREKREMGIVKQNTNKTPASTITPSSQLLMQMQIKKVNTLVPALRVPRDKVDVVRFGP